MGSFRNICGWSLLAVLMAACAGFDDITEVETDPAGEDVLVCSIDEAHTGSSTKVSLSLNRVPVWSSGDEISVFLSSGAHERFLLTGGQGTGQGTFSGRLPTSDSYYAVYPYDASNAYSGNQLTFSRPQGQIGVPDDIPACGNAMVASFTKESLAPAFSNIFGLLCINMSGTARVGKVTVTSNKSDEMLWGSFHLTANGLAGTDAQTLSVSGGNNVTSLNFSTPVRLSEGASRPFYFVLPAGTLSSGFVLDVYDGNGNKIFTQNTSGNQHIMRSKIRSMATLENVNSVTGEDAVSEPFTWAAYNNLARTGTSYETVIDPSTYPAPKSGKYVGMFYFVWHTTNSSSGGPYDIQEFLGAGQYNFSDVLNYGCGAAGGKTHHWGKPYLGYYRDDDLWVLRKHVQMLADAGVDFIAFDVTNHAFYETEITKFCNLLVQMRSEGYTTPQLTFMVWHSKATGSESERENFNHNVAVTYLYNTFYAKQAYSDLWFRWDGKPLMMAIGDHVTTPSIRNFFTFRQTWYLWNNHAQTTSDVGDPWYYQYGGPNDKWPWAVAYTDDTNNPMRAGTHNGVNELCPVSPATHPVSNIGRSYPINQGITYYSGANSYTKNPALGTYFKSQFNAANNLDPKILFFTGWNEFLMGHFAPGALEFYWCCGVRAYNSMFIDQYNHEFSRDIEPVEGGFGDSYYYYMVDFIRKFKGVSSLPVYSKRFTITVDGDFSDWNSVGSCYADDKFDTKWRGYDYNNGANGWLAYGGTLPNYVNQTGRNDLQFCKVATDGSYVSFYVQAAGNLVVDANLKLLITSGGGSSWEGFNYLVELTSGTKATLKRASGSGYAWTTVSEDIPVAVSGSRLELRIPLSSVGVSNSTSFSLDFKWVDNVDLSQSDGIQRCMRDGDSAPNGRFRYRYIFNM